MSVKPAQREKGGADPGAGRWSVVEADLGTGERLPLLVDRATWVPASLPLRYAVLLRRYQCALSTLRGDMDALRLLYRWGSEAGSSELERRLSGLPLFSREELASLRWFLERYTARETAGGGLMLHSATLGRYVATIRAFLAWAAVPSNRNERGAAPADLPDFIAGLEFVFRPITGGGQFSMRRRPLSMAEIRLAESLLAPLSDETGRILNPVRWHGANPFKGPSRTRNWLLWLLGIDAGLRMGEALKLRVDDVIVGPDLVTYLRVVRRPDDADDPRGRQPAVKTRERLIPASERVLAALRLYQANSGRLGRRRGTSYLLTSRHGRPISQTGASQAIGLLVKALGANDLTFHSLRHTFFEGLANDLYLQQEADASTAKELVKDVLREVGGWTQRSLMPEYYAQHAIALAARRQLVRRNERLFRHATSEQSNG